MILSALSAALPVLLLAQKHTEPGLHTETVQMEKEHVIEPGQQLKQAILLTAHHQQKRLAVLSTSIHLAVQLDVPLALEITVHGEHGALVVWESRLELEHGQLLKHA